MLFKVVVFVPVCGFDGFLVACLHLQLQANLWLQWFLGACSHLFPRQQFSASLWLQRFLGACSHSFQGSNFLVYLIYFRVLRFLLTAIRVLTFLGFRFNNSTYRNLNINFRSQISRFNSPQLDFAVCCFLSAVGLFAVCLGRRVGLGGFCFVLTIQSCFTFNLMYLSILSILTDSKRQSFNVEFPSSLRDSDWKMFYFCSEPWTLCTYSRLVLLSTQSLPDKLLTQSQINWPF